MVVGQIENFLGQILRLEDEVGKPCIDDASGHAVKLGALGLLSHHDAAVFFDGFDSVGAVGSRSRKDDADSLVAAFFGKRGEKDVDGMVDGSVIVIAQKKVASFNGEIFLRRDQVYLVGSNFHQMLGLYDLHGSVFAQNLSHQAFVVGRQVLHNDKGDVRVRGQLDEELLERLKASGRSADADHKAHIVEFEMLEDWFFVVIIGQDNLSNLGNS